jgi:hypothetical protein
MVAYEIQTSFYFILSILETTETTQEMDKMKSPYFSARERKGV